MTHLRIEQNHDNIESLGDNDSVIEKIYELVSSNSLDKSSNFIGKVSVRATYDKYLDLINNDHEGICKNFDILADDTYIWFEDPNVEAALKAYYSNITTKGIKASDIIGSMNRKVFQDRDNNPSANSYGTQIISFNELSKLTNIKTITSFLFNDCSKLRSIDLSNITIFGGSTDGDLGHFGGCTSLTSLGDTTNILNLGPNAAFWNCSSLPSFTLGPLITRIPKNCFYHCTSLTTINGSPQNLQTLGNSCFEGCSSLLNINIDLSNLTYIGNACFKGCSSLLQINLLTNLTSIPSSFFLNCGSLTTVTGLSNITSINNDAFNECSNLITIDIDWSKLTNIGGYAFHNCNKLEYNIDLSKVTAIGSGAFMKCSKITITKFPKATTYYNGCFADGVKVLANIVIPKEVQTFDLNIFRNCTLLETISFENNSLLSSMSSNCFLNCSNLIKVIFPDSFTSYSYAIFINCTSLRYVVHPVSFTEIGANINFSGVNNCAIIFKSATPPNLVPYTNNNISVWNSVFGSYNCISNGQINSNANTIYVPDNCVQTYKNSFINDEQTSIGGGQVNDIFELFINNLIRPLSDLSSDIRTELGITQADIDRVPNNS